VKTEEYTRPVLIAGAIAGVLSAVPLVNLLNIICCLWILVGGVIGVYILKSDSGRKIEYGEGALIGLLSGLVAAVVSTVLNTLLALAGLNIGMMMMQRMINRFPEFEQFRDMMSAARVGVFSIITGLLFSLVIFGAFGALGGVIGTAIYGKKKETGAVA